MLNKLKTFADLIKFEHTVFALPFAYMGMLLASPHHIAWPKFFWVTVAMASARTAGMTLNRLIDLKIDALNPRTMSRPLLTGEFSIRHAWLGVALSLGVFFTSAWMLNPVCFKLSFVALAFLTGYHYVKRFSFLCHFTLGAVLAIAPMGGWLAVRPVFDWIPVLVALAVLFWVAGFDILYSLQDADFDRAHGLHSIPVRYGQPQALKISSACHLVTAGLLVLLSPVAGLGVVYWLGVAITVGLLWTEHRLISETDLSRVNTAFFTINGWVGILLLIFTFLETFR